MFCYRPFQMPGCGSGKRGGTWVCQRLAFASPRCNINSLVVSGKKALVAGEGEAALALPAWFALRCQHGSDVTWWLAGFDWGLDQMTPCGPVLLLGHGAVPLKPRRTEQAAVGDNLPPALSSPVETRAAPNQVPCHRWEREVSHIPVQGGREQRGMWQSSAMFLPPTTSHLEAISHKTRAME